MVWRGFSNIISTMTVLISGSCVSRDSSTNEFWREEFRQRNQGGPPVMDFGLMAMYAGQAIHCLTKLYENLLDDSEEVDFRIRVLGTKDRQIISLDPGRYLHGAYVCKIPEVGYHR